MLIHSLVMSLVDYCSSILADAPKIMTGKLQLVLNAAARIVSGTRKFNWGVSQLLHTELHWLDVLERVGYKLGVMMNGCLHGQAPRYLVHYCMPVSDFLTRQHLCSASRRFLVILLIILSSSVFSVAGRRSGTLSWTICVTRHWQRQLHSRSDNVSIFDILAHSAH